MKTILAIETSSEACSVAWNDGSAAYHRFRHAPMQHAELLLPMVEEVLGEAGSSLAAVDAIAFGRGPGSFTSLRIGIGVVQGLAWGAERCVVPVSSLAAVAEPLMEQARQLGCPVVVAMDARMDEVFWAVFDPEAGQDPTEGLLGDEKEQVTAPERLVESLPEHFIAAGNGFSRFESLRESSGRALAVVDDAWPDARSVGVIARRWLDDHAALPAAQAQPVYIRDNVARKSGEQ